MILILAGLIAAVGSAALTPVVRSYARRRGIMDDPTIQPQRRLHSQPVPLLGGLAIWLSFSALVSWLALADQRLAAGYIQRSAILAILIGSAVIMVGGYLDDRYALRPRYSVVFPAIAAVVAVVGGIGVHFITRPWGGVWRLDGWKIWWPLATGGPAAISVWPSLFTFLWLMGMMYTTKFLDGLDGLVSGLAVIGALVVAGLSLTAVVHQPDTALLAVIVAGAFAGFLYYNWSPASVFLGEGGSVLAGFLLGVLAVIAGGKIATTLLVIGVPVLDVVWVLTRRLLWDRRSLVQADRKHLHFRLLDAGFTPRQAVLVLWGVSLLAGVPSLFLRTSGKVIAFTLLFGGSLLAAAVLVSVPRRRPGRPRGRF